MFSAVEKCNPDHSTGTFLSGGLDSSTVTGILAQQQKAKSFTIGFDDPDYDESGYARIAAKHFSTLHHEYRVTPQDVCDIITRIAQHYSEPFGNSSVVPAYYCAKLAKDNGIGTLLAGDGGDELFGGNTRYARQKIFNVYNYIPGLLRKNLVEPIISNFPYGSKIALINKIQSYIAQANVPLPDRLETYNFLFRTPANDMFTGDFLQSVDQEYPFSALQHAFESANTSSILNKMLFLDWKFTLYDNDLQKVNEMCKLAEIKVRYPFLDDDIVSFSLSLAPRLKVKGHKLRYFFKLAMSDFLPKEILYKQKHGFGLPFGIWMSNKKMLKDMAYDSLSSLKQRNIVKKAYIDNLVKLHQSDHAAYYGEFIWVLMMLDLWFREHY
jgi:asparagine synthase (glutamine-hydrolysing)